MGIFLGMQVTEWNEEGKNEARTLNYYDRLIGDIESERRALLARIDYMQVTDSYGHSALDLLNQDASKFTSDYFVALYQASQIWTYSVQRGTYDEILASGIAEAIPDSILRTRLGNFYLSAEATRQIIVATTPYRQRIRRYLPNDIQSLIRENCSDEFILSERSLLILKLPSSCDVSFSERQITEATQALVDYRDLKQDLVQRLASIASKRGAIDAQIIMMDSIIDEIHKHQNKYN